MVSTYFQFIAGAILVSLSGVMAPGPMSAVTVGKGSESPKAGMLIAAGHGIIEFPLMFAIFFGFGHVFGLPFVKPSIGLAGGAVLLFMGIGMFKNLRKGDFSAMNDRRSPLMAGLMLSMANPYFIIWWATVGAAFVVRSAEFGAIGLLTFMVCHWLCDFFWCWFLSSMSYRGGKMFGEIFQKAVFALSGTILLVFSGKFIYESITGLI